MATWGGALAQSLAERMNERRRFLAEQRAVADERLRGIEATRRSTVGRARETLQASADILITRGFSESEVAQLIETDPKEAIRIGALVAEGDTRPEDIRTAITFRNDYRPETPLSELIKEATPIFRDIEEPEPAARQQNIFQRLFSMDVSQDMDRYYRQSNFGGYSGYDILGSVEASPYRERTGAPIVDYGAIPTQLTDTQRREYADGIEKSITNIAKTIIDGIDNIPLVRRLEGIKDSPRAIIDLMFDSSEANAANYTALAPYRESLLEDLASYYQQAPAVFGQPQFGTKLSGIIEEYVSARNEEGAPTEGAPGGITVTTLPPPVPANAVDLGEITEENAREVFNRVTGSEQDVFVVDGEVTPKAVVLTLLSDMYGVGREEDLTPFRRYVEESIDSSEMLSESRASSLFNQQRTALATGEFGPGSAPIRRWFRYFNETNPEVLTEARAVEAATDLMNEKRKEIIDLIADNRNARELFEENPLRFLEEYAEQLSGE